MNCLYKKEYSYLRKFQEIQSRDPPFTVQTFKIKALSAHVAALSFFQTAIKVFLSLLKEGDLRFL